MRDALQLMLADVGRQFDPDILTRFFKIAHTLPTAAARAPVAGAELPATRLAPRVTQQRIPQPRALPS